MFAIYNIYLCKTEFTIRDTNYETAYSLTKSSGWKIRAIPLALSITLIQDRVKVSIELKKQLRLKNYHLKEEGPFWPFSGPTQRTIPQSGCCRRGLEVLKTIFFKFF